MNVINSFRSIILRERSLIICDIDDTILDYGEIIEKYWKDNVHDPDFSNWHNIIKNTTPDITNNDFHDFIQHINQTNSEIHLVTHRNKSFLEITNLHLSMFGINGLPVHFLGGHSKGKYSITNFNIEDRDIIFIDDSESNHSDFLLHVPNVKQFLFLKNKCNY